MNEIDRALRNEQRVEPTDGFRFQVMQAVYAQQASGRQRQRMEFHQFWPSVAVASVVVPLLFAVKLLDGPEANARYRGNRKVAFFDVDRHFSWGLVVHRRRGRRVDLPLRA